MSRDESPENPNLYRSVSGPCPYLEGKGPWATSYFIAESFDPGAYESMLESGWRRSGTIIYRNECSGCSQCIPIRVDAPGFVPSPSQRRCERRNADIFMEISPLEYREERYRLYRKYVLARHGREGVDQEESRGSYARFLLESPLPGVIADYYAIIEGDKALVGNGYLDVLPDGLSSVYFAFDPDWAKRSLGVYSVIREIKLCAELGKRWYYLGFWVPGSRKMDYKARYRPAQIAPGGSWMVSSSMPKSPATPNSLTPSEFSDTRPLRKKVSGSDSS
jgi:leucyl-tRNA---protein transferase